jgi:hypothetical protein
MRASVVFFLLTLLSVASGSENAFAFGSRPSAPAPAPAPTPAPTPTPAPQPVPPSPPSGPAGVPNFSTACLNKTGGTWDFGESPDACDVSDQEATAYVASQYAAVIFDDASAKSGGRPRYMSEMYPVLREMGTYYIKRRNPSVSAAELDGWLHALFTLAHQESFWTHYRSGTDKVLRFMRGDSLHGYGLMQVDDRSHSKAINQGQGVDLADNLLLGLDIFYANWVRSATASCVSSPSDYHSRARAAWAAYNGGQGSICRWTNSNSQWAANDKGFEAKFSGQRWLPYVSNPNASSPLDVRCLAEGSRPCAAPQGGR